MRQVTSRLLLAASFFALSALFACGDAPTSPGDAGTTGTTEDAGGGGGNANASALNGDLAFAPQASVVRFRALDDGGVDLSQRYVILFSAAPSGGCETTPGHPYKAVQIYIQGEVDGGSLGALGDHYVNYVETFADGGTRSFETTLPDGGAGEIVTLEGSFDSFELAASGVERTAGTFSVGGWYRWPDLAVVDAADAGMSLSGNFDAELCPVTF